MLPMEKISVFINNRNRLSTLKCLVEWLCNKNIEIVILDNDSIYPPLIDNLQSHLLYYNLEKYYKT